MDTQRPYNPKPPSSCAECGFLADCGGLEGEAFDRGCFQRCVSHCQFKSCDMACPCLHLNFADLIEEVGGLCLPPQRRLISGRLDDLPFYIPHIEHGYRRDAVLTTPVVCVPLTALVGTNRRGQYVVRYDTPEAMRAGLRLSGRADVVVSSVAPDRYIEDFWAWHEARHILEQLANLKLRAMTVPNFSFMNDVPRINSLYNLSRIFRVAERISDAGIPTVLHLQASTRHDWARWVSVLRDQPHLRHVALEFQTGPEHREIGDRYFSGLVNLQSELGRSLHPIVLAGACRVRELAIKFRSFSVVDSTPFIKTHKRKELSHAENGGWRSRWTIEGESLSPLLEHNVAFHSRRVLQRAGLTSDHPQQEFHLPPAA